jgi:NAD(P)-dependent dehydrogenase (short-subunit alcohol dehydrogenase family)
MMLKDKVAVIYGAGGAVGGAVARAFAHEGAKLFLTGRHLGPVEAVAKDVVSSGGAAEAAAVDALDEQAVDEHLQSVIDKAGRVDISFDAVGIPDANSLGVPLVDLDVEQLSLRITTYAMSYFLTARLAAADGSEQVGGDHDRHHTPLADGHPRGGRLWCRDGRQGGTHSRSIRRARTSRHSGGRSATTGHAGDTHDQGWIRASRQGSGDDLGTVAGAARWQDPPATAHDARGDGKHSGLHGIGSGERDDGNDRQLDHGEPGRLAASDRCFA